MSPADKKRAKELYPAFYKQRKKLLKRQTKNLFELARLKIEGVQDMNDLKTQYMAETGRLDLGPLQNLLHPEETFSFQGGDARDREMYAQAKFQRGLLSPFRVFGAEATPTFRDRNQWTGGDMRRENERNFRPSTGTAWEQGLYGQGFPPFKGNNPLQEQDKAWWEKLRQQ